MSSPINQDIPENIADAIEVLESDVADSRVHAIVDNPTDEVIAEG